jgi:hypothetical protein
MSLDTTLTRIGQIETMLATPMPTGAATTATAGDTGGTSSTSTSSASPTFAAQLLQATSAQSALGASASAEGDNSDGSTQLASSLDSLLPGSTAASTAATGLGTTAAATGATTAPTTATTALGTTTTTATTALPGGTTELPTTATTALPTTATTLPGTTTALPATLVTTTGAPTVLSGSSTAGNPTIVAIAATQIGQQEQPMGSNNSPAIATYRTATEGAMAGEPWCAYFVSWASREAGTPLGDQGQGFGSVSQIWSWAQEHGRAITNGPGVVPKPGDLICFGGEHVGIVDKVLPNGDVETIEGNYSNQVSQVIRSPTEATGYVDMS